jgi:hypothetical protein
VNAVDYNQSSEDEQLLEGHGPSLELNPEVAHPEGPVPERSANRKGKEEEPASRVSVVPVERKAVLDHSDILRMTSDKNYKFIRALSDHEQQPAGFINSIYNFDDELDGYTSPGGTVRMTKGVANVVFIALAAEAPNTLVLKARQEAFEQIIKQAEAQAKRQQDAYDEQQRRIARDTLSGNLAVQQQEREELLGAGGNADAIARIKREKEKRREVEALRSSFTDLSQPEQSADFEKLSQEIGRAHV